MDDTINNKFGVFHLNVLKNEFNNTFATVGKTLSRKNPTLQTPTTSIFRSLTSNY